MNYDTFVTEVKKLGVKKLLKEVTKYADLSPTKQRYAEYKGKLVGAYSPQQGGVIFKKPPNRWSKGGRKFEDVII
jgi:hypothetical protein